MGRPTAYLSASLLRFSWKKVIYKFYKKVIFIQETCAWYCFSEHLLTTDCLWGLLGMMRNGRGEICVNSATFDSWNTSEFKWCQFTLFESREKCAFCSRAKGKTDLYYLQNRSNPDALEMTGLRVGWHFKNCTLTTCRFDAQRKCCLQGFKSALKTKL